MQDIYKRYSLLTPSTVQAGGGQTGFSIHDKLSAPDVSVNVSLGVGRWSVTQKPQLIHDVLWYVL